MYPVDDKDKVIELDYVPQSSVGAPLPVVISDEHRILLAYLCENRSPDWDGASVRIADPHTFFETVTLIEFERYHAYMFGPPNDEAFEGHPLAKRGLAPYAAFEILDSSWVRQLERMNSIHRHHRPEYFAELKHFIFAFHDSTFECVAKGFKISEFSESLAELVEQMTERLMTAYGF